MTRGVFAILAFVLGMLCISADARAQVAEMPRQLEEVGVTEHLDGQLPLDATFHDHTGKPVKLGDVFDGKRPVVLTFAYHTCPVVCSMIAHNLAKSLKQIPWQLGDEFQALTISIDPTETLENTANKRTGVLAEYGRATPAQAESWHFLDGDEATIKRVADAAGFKFKYDPEQKIFAHTSLVMVVTPDGRMARYLYGFEAQPSDLKLALLEASQGRSISTVEQIILYCYHYDPQGGRYVLVAQRVMQVGAAGIAIVLFGLLGTLWLRELKKKKKKGVTESDKAPETREATT